MTEKRQLPCIYGLIKTLLKITMLVLLKIWTSLVIYHLMISSFITPPYYKLIKLSDKVGCQFFKL